MNPVPITMSNSAADCMDEQVVSQGAGTGGAIYYYHRNQQYSVTAITTSTGTIAERYAYSACGQPTILDGSGSVLSTSSISNRYTYTGREWDATLGLHHFRARWMSPSAGRFLGRDPIGYEDGLACAQVCLRSGLPCPLLKHWCNSLSGVEQEVCDEYYKYTCGRVSGG